MEQDGSALARLNEQPEYESAQQNGNVFEVRSSLSYSLLAYALLFLGLAFSYYFSNH